MVVSATVITTWGAERRGAEIYTLMWLGTLGDGLEARESYFAVFSL
jgi:hypothetical protein